MKNISFRCQPTADVGDLLTINPSLMTHFTNWGRSVLCLLSVCWLSNADLNAQVSLSASAGTASGSYTTLSAAFTAINAGTHQGAITISLTADVTEVATATLNNSGHISGAVYTSVSITPSGARTISGTVAGAPLIDLNGCDVVTIDGLNTGGNSLVISNLSTAATANTSTIRFMIDATNNILRNCSILGSATVPLATNGGTIYFATGLTTGNDNNTISTCNIGPAGANLPSKAIYGQGSTTNAAICNSGISIANCNIYDFFLAGGCAGVYALTGNTEWSMTNNKVYQTAARAMTSTLYGLYFANSTYGSGITMTGNTIGYTSNAGTGTCTLTGTGGFQGIFLTISSTAALASNLNNNTVSNISLTSTSGVCYGIYNSSTASSNTVNINNNTVRNFTILTSTGACYGIWWTSATNISVSNNTVDNLTRNTSGTTYGIYSFSSSVNEVINNNIVSNLVNTSTSATSVTIRGIYQFTTSGTKEYKNNRIFNLSTTATGTSNTIEGIRVQSSTTLDISGNEVYGISGLGTSVYGIYTSATAATVYKNKIYDLSSTHASAAVGGIYAGASSGTYYNNIIGDLRATAANLSIAIYGINVQGGTANNLYNNTVYLNATSTGALFGTAAVYASSTAPARMNNNLLVNNSVPMGALGFTAAFRRSGVYNATYYDVLSNNNSFYAGTPSLNYVIFYDGTTAYQGLSDYKTFVASRDQSSFTTNPTWVSTTGSAATYLHIPASATPNVLESSGIVLSNFTTDFDGDARPGPTGSVNGGGASYDIGADEFDGKPAIPTIGALSSTLPTTQCTAVARTVTAMVTPVAPLTAVTLYYTTNGANLRTVVMTGGDPGVASNWTATIPAASPTNGTIAWYVGASDGTYSVQKGGSSYADEPLLGVTATASATPATVCAGSPSSVTVNFRKPGIATVGAGATTSSLNGSSPFAGGYGGSKSQFIIKASELTAAGMGAGAFNSLAINCTSSGQAYPLFNVAIGSTALNVMTNSFVGGLTDVFSSASYTPTVGVNTFTFTTPYVWDGVSNIIVSFCWNTGLATSTGSTVKVDAVSFVSSYGWIVDSQVGSAMCAITGTPTAVPANSGSTSLNRPQFLIDGNLIPVMAGFAWSTSAGAAGTTQTITPNVNTNTTYNVIATGPANCTIAASTAVATLALPATPTGTSTAQCGTRVPSCSVTSTTGAATPIFRWYKVSTGGTPLAGESGATLSAYSITSNDTFYVAEFNGTCESARRQLTVAVSTPELLTLSTPTTTCNNGTVALQVTSSLGNFDTYRWSPATNLFTNPACTNAYVAGTSATQVYAKSPVAGAAVYTCNSANVGCTNSQSTTVNVLPTSVIASAVGSSQFCTSGAATIRIAATPVGAGLQWQESPDGGGWADVVSATAASYTTPTLTQTNYYRLALKKSNGTECAYSNTLTVTISTPSVGVSEHGTKCGPGAVTLNVSGNNGDINWFTAATGGTAIATGNRYIPTLNAVGTTPFYAEASIIAGSYTGLGNGTATVPATTGASAERGIVFTASKNFTLVSAQYYSPTLSVTNSVVVRLLNDADGAVLNTVTLPIVQGATADWYTMNLNFEVTAGRTYRLLASFGQSVNRVSTGVDYTNVAFNNLGALGVINGGYDSGLSATTYSYFHNITAMEICKSPRQVVNATVTAPPALTLSNATTTICAGTPTSAVTVSSTLSDFATYTWSPAAGVTGTTSPVFNPSATTTYTLSAAQTSGNFCQNNASVTVTVNPLPSTPIITPATAVLCTGDGAVQLAASAPGIVQKIGTPGTSNAATGVPSPYSNYFGGAKHQMLFTATELTAAGLSGGSSISAIKLTVTGLGTTFTGSLQNFHLKVGATALTTLSATFEGGLTEVVAPSTVAVAVGDVQHTFSTAFIWNGTSNLILETSYSNANTGISTDAVLTEYTTGLSFNACNYYRTDGATAASVAAATTGTTSTTRPNVTFVTLPVNCNWQALTTGLYTDAAATTPYVSGTVASVYAKPSATTTYTATSVSNAGCTSTATTMVTVAARPMAVIANSRPTTFCTGDSTVLTASGTGAYLWSTGATSAAITVTTAGVYKVKVTNAAGCADSTMVTVTVNARPTAAIANSRPTTFCAGDSTVLTASGSGTYRWSTGATTADVTAKVSGTYKVVVTNASGCADSAMIVVTANSRLAPVIANSRPTTFCVGDSTVLTASASGAATYAWSTGATTAAVTARTAGTYKVTVTSAAGCVDSTMASITVNTRPTAGVTNNRPTTFCAGDSTILTASGGGTYVWSTGATTTAVTARTTGTYKVTVTNASGCVDSTMIAVTTNARPVAAIAGATAICAGDSTIFTASGGGTYAWSNAATTAGITVKTAGTYKVVVTNASGCVDSTTRTLVVNARPTAGLSVSGVATFCQGDSTKLTATGGATYRWTTPSGTLTTNPITAKVSGVYKALVFNAAGCTDSVDITITVNPKPTVAFTSTSLGGSATFTNTSTGGNTYSWSFGDTTLVATTMNTTRTYRANGTYTVKLVVTSAAGCRDSITNTIVITRVANEEILAGLKALVYPNPTARNLHIEFQTTTIQFGVADYISVTDAFGREVHRQAIGGTSVELNTENWASGLYMINAVISNQKIGLSKVVKLDK